MLSSAAASVGTNTDITATAVLSPSAVVRSMQHSTPTVKGAAGKDAVDFSQPCKLFGSPVGVVGLVHSPETSCNSAVTVKIGEAYGSVDASTAISNSSGAASKFEGYSFLENLLNLMIKRDAVLARPPESGRTSFDRAAALIDDAIDVSKLKAALVHYAETFRGYK